MSKINTLLRMINKWFALSIPFTWFLYFILIQYDNESSTSLDFFEWMVNTAVITFISIGIIKKSMVKHFSKFVVLMGFIGYLFILYRITTYIPLAYFFNPMYFKGGFNIEWGHINLVPFKQIFDSVVIDAVIHKQLMPVKLIQIFGNLFLLVPLTFSVLYLDIINKPKNAVLMAMFISLSIEIYQFGEGVICSAYLGCGRGTDIDDVILNTLGGIVGAVMYVFLNRKYGKIKSKNHANNYFHDTVKRQ